MRSIDNEKTSGVFPRKWSTPKRVKTIVAGAALSLLVVAAVTQHQLTNAGTQPVETRAATYEGVTIEVPASWTVNGDHCGTPIEDTVQMGERSALQCLTYPVPVSSASFRSLESDSADPLPATDTGRIVSVDLIPTQQVESVYTTTPPATLPVTIAWPSITFYQTDVIIEQLDVRLTIRSTQPAIVAAVVNSIHISG